MLTNKQNKQTAITREHTATKALVWWVYLEKATHKSSHIKTFQMPLSNILFGAYIVGRSYVTFVSRMYMVLYMAVSNCCCAKLLPHIRLCAHTFNIFKISYFQLTLLNTHFIPSRQF